MEIPDSLLSLHTAEVTERDGSYVVEIPPAEIEQGNVTPGQSLRVGLLTHSDDQPERAESRPARSSAQADSGPPVEEGETVEVEIEDLGDQGDGIARIGPGFIVFVPGTDLGDRVTVEITDARDNFAFGDVIEGPY